MCHALHLEINTQGVGRFGLLALYQDRGVFQFWPLIDPRPQESIHNGLQAIDHAQLIGTSTIYTNRR